MKMNKGERLGLIVILVLVPINLAIQAWAGALTVICIGLIICWLASTRDLARARYAHAVRPVSDGHVGTRTPDE